MGLLFTTEGTRRIIDTLNTAFDGPNRGLDVIRSALPNAPKLSAKIASRNGVHVLVGPGWPEKAAFWRVKTGLP